MSTPLVSAKPVIEIEEATKIMCQNKIKKIPVVEKGKLLGLVTLTDILRIQPQLIKMYKIFSNDLAPRRMKKVFNYYLLVQPKSDATKTGHLKIPKFKRVPIKRSGAPVRYEVPEPISTRWNSAVRSPKSTE